MTLILKNIIWGLLAVIANGPALLWNEFKNNKLFVSFRKIEWGNSVDTIEEEDDWSSDLASGRWHHPEDEFITKYQQEQQYERIKLYINDRVLLKPDEVRVSAELWGPHYKPLKRYRMRDLLDVHAVIPDDTIFEMYCPEINDIQTIGKVDLLCAIDSGKLQGDSLLMYRTVEVVELDKIVDNCIYPQSTLQLEAAYYKLNNIIERPKFPEREVLY